MAKKDDPAALEKLLKLTKLIKTEKVAVTKKGEARPNKYRTAEPKFEPKGPKREDLVDGGGMDVDPDRKKEYDNWRADKLAEKTAPKSLIRRADPPSDK